MHRKKSVGICLLLLSFLTVSILSALTAEDKGIAIVVSGIRHQIIPASSIAAVQKGQTVDAKRNSGKIMIFHDKQIKLTVVTGPSNDMLSYRIQGERNPVLDVPKGVTLDILFINEDDDMKHDIRFSRMPPPYSGTPDEGKTTGSDKLPPHTKKSFSGERLKAKFTVSGTYYYLCTVRGHAAGGMYGKIIVK